MAITLMLFDMHIPGFGLEQAALAMGQNIGTGLGLAIVKNIALQYGGSATAMPPRRPHDRGGGAGGVGGKRTTKLGSQSAKTGSRVSIYPYMGG